MKDLPKNEAKRVRESDIPNLVYFDVRDDVWVLSLISELQH